MSHEWFAYLSRRERGYRRAGPCWRRGGIRAIVVGAEKKFSCYMRKTPLKNVHDGEWMKENKTTLRFAPVSQSAR
jgi:hypothetical protein